MSEINVSKVLDELKNQIDEYDIKPLMLKTVRSKFYATYGIYPDERIVNLEETIEKSIQQLRARYIKAFGNLDTARLFYQMQRYQYAYRGADNENTKDLILHHYSSLDNSSILFIIRYGINGAFDKNFGIVDKFLDEHEPKIMYDSRIWTLKLGNVSIKSFKNGKVVISGLMDEQKNRIISGFETVTKYQNVTV